MTGTRVWDALVAAIFALIAATGVASAQVSVVNACQGAKMKAAGRKAGCLAGLRGKVIGSGIVLNPVAVANCERKVSAAYAKLEDRGGCGTTGDAGVGSSRVDLQACKLEYSIVSPK